MRTAQRAEISPRLREAVRALGSQRETAQAIGMRTSTLAAYLRGERTVAVDDERILRLADLLHVPRSEAFLTAGQGGASW